MNEFTAPADRSLRELEESRQRWDPPIEVQRRLPSTQTHLWHLWEAGGDPTVVVAVEQSDGQGRRQRSWSSPPGGLWFSLAHRASRLEGLSLLAGLAVARVLQQHGLSPWMRWPNDIMVGWPAAASRKLAGILVDARGAGQQVLAVIGIGLNVDVDPSCWPPDLQGVAASMTEQGLARPHMGELLLQLLQEWTRLAQTHSRSGLAPFHSELEALVVGPGREVKIWEGQVESIDRIVGLGPDGSLTLASGRCLYSVERLAVL